MLTSPARCARDAAQALGFDEARHEDRIAEVDYGRWQGRSLKDLANEEPEALAAWCRDPRAAPHGGESFCDVAARVAGWLEQLDGPAEVVAVSHAAVLRAAIVHALDGPPSAFSRIEIAPLSWIELRRSARGWSWWPR